MRKLRTRPHVIEDLGFNHIEKQILLAGFTMYRHGINDYGVDGFIQCFKETGEIDDKIVNFQLKSTDHIQYLSSKKTFTFDLDVRDLEFWLSNQRQTLLILFDAQKEVSYFIDLAFYFQKIALEIYLLVYLLKKYQMSKKFLTVQIAAHLQQE